MVRKIAIGQLHLPSRYVREETDADHIDFLAGDIQRRGILEPLLVRQVSPRNFEIINGVHRYEACKTLGKDTIPCIVITATDQQALSIQILTNYRTKRIRDHELVRSVGMMHDDLGMRHDAIGDELRYSKGYISKLYNIWRNKQLYEQLRTGEITLREAYSRVKEDRGFPGKQRPDLRCFVCGRLDSPEFFSRPAACPAHAPILKVVLDSSKVVYALRKEDGLDALSKAFDRAAGEVLAGFRADANQ